MNTKEIFNRIIDNWPAKILSFAFAIILVQFYKESLLEKKYFSVPLIIENTNELVPASSVPRIIKVSVWGNTTDIAPIKEDDILAILDFSSISDDGEHKIPIKTRVKGTAQGIDSIEIHVHPSEIKVKLEKRLSKRINVKLALKGTPLENYEVYESEIDPSSIEVTGPYSEVSKIEEAFTEPVSIDNRKAGLIGNIGVFNANPLILIVGNSKISYSVKIREMVQVKTFENIQISFENLSENLEIVESPELGSVTVRASKSIMQTWKPSVNVLKVLCENIQEPGSYTLPVQAVIPGRLELIDAEPKNIQIEFKIREIKEDDKTDSNKN